MTLNQYTKTEKIIYPFIIIILVLSLYIGFSNVPYFNDTFAKEDGTVENVTALFLLSICLIQVFRFFKLRKYKNGFWIIGTLFFAIMFLFGSGEEISWGQRIFNFETGEYFTQNNLQNETNLHNLKIGSVKLNKLIFSQLLVIGLVIYLIILPIIYKRYNRIKMITNKFAIPIPKTHHTIAFIAGTIIIAIIPDEASRKWEVYEMVFGALFLLIFLNPINSFLFKKELK